MLGAVSKPRNRFLGAPDYAHEVKAHWQRVIDHYATSEEIMGTLGETAIAASVSFAALEGLTRSFISTYAERDEWLNKDLTLKRGKRIIDAIEIVAKEELGAHEKVFKQASQDIYNVRNQTMHLDLKADEDARKCISPMELVTGTHRNPNVDEDWSGRNTKSDRTRNIQGHGARYVQGHT